MTIRLRPSTVKDISARYTPVAISHRGCHPAVPRAISTIRTPSLSSNLNQGVLTRLTPTSRAKSWWLPTHAPYRCSSSSSRSQAAWPTCAAHRSPNGTRTPNSVYTTPTSGASRRVSPSRPSYNTNPPSSPSANASSMASKIGLNSTKSAS